MCSIICNRRITAISRKKLLRRQWSTIHANRQWPAAQTKFNPQSRKKWTMNTPTSTDSISGPCQEIRTRRRCLGYTTTTDERIAKWMRSQREERRETDIWRLDTYINTVRHGKLSYDRVSHNGNYTS